MLLGPWVIPLKTLIVLLVLSTPMMEGTTVWTIESNV